MSPYHGSWKKTIYFKIGLFLAFYYLVVAAAFNLFLFLFFGRMRCSSLQFLKKVQAICFKI